MLENVYVMISAYGQQCYTIGVVNIFYLNQLQNLDTLVRAHGLLALGQVH